MRKSVYLIGFLLVACSDNNGTDKKVSTTESETAEFRNDEAIDQVTTPDRATYLDESIAAEVQLEFGPLNQVVYAIAEGEHYPVQLYEGTLMEASGAAAGFNLRFEPFDHYDHRLEREVKSQYDFSLNVVLSKEQNRELGFVNYDKQTGNLAWDYFENLFKVYYFENDGSNYPLKFINLGKTEWDG